MTHIKHLILSTLVAMVVIIPASAQNSVVERSWNNIIENGDASGEYGDIPCAVSKTDTKDLSPAEIETDGGNKVFAVHAGKKVENAWENQFWIQSPIPFAKDEMVKVSFRYKATAPAAIKTETHATPSEYLHWDCIGSVNFTDEWPKNRLFLPQNRYGPYLEIGMDHTSGEVSTIPLKGLFQRVKRVV